MTAIGQIAWHSKFRRNVQREVLNNWSLFSLPCLRSFIPQDNANTNFRMVV